MFNIPRRFLAIGLCATMLATVAIAADLNADAQAELKESKAASLRCKKEVVKAVKKSFPDDNNNGGALLSKTLNEIRDFCGDKWYSECVVIQKSSGKCSFIETDKKTREKRGKKKYFPKDFI